MNKELVRKLFPDHVKRAEKGLCPTCGKKISIQDFKAPIDFKEFTISGMCQQCQDSVFGS